MTLNDSNGHAASAPNFYQNYPVLTSGQTNPNETIVGGTLTSTPDTTYTLEFYANPGLSPLGHGDGQINLGTAQVTTDATGTAAFRVTLPKGTAVGSYLAATATDPGGNTSEFSASIPLSVASATMLSVDVNPAPFGQDVTFTATMIPATATGTVTFLDGTTPIGTAAITSGVATLTTNTLAVGTHTITASYGGDADNGASLSNGVSQVIDQASSTTMLEADPSPSAVGQPVTFTATVSPAAASGSVTFLDGTTTPATTLATIALVDGQAIFTTSTLASGTHDISAVYEGDANVTGSTSATVSQTVILSSRTLLDSSANLTSYGQPVTFTATVAPADATGSVTFLDGAIPLGTVPLDIDGTAAWTTSTLAVGTHAITAMYTGDAMHVSSTSTAVNQVVNQASTTTTLATSGTPSTVGESLTFTATVLPATATGTVTFKDGAITLGIVPLTGTGGPALFSTSALRVGTHAITAVYSGDTNDSGSSSAALNQVVNQTGTTTTLSATNSPSTFGQNAIITATLDAPNATGYVTFKEGAKTLGTITVLGGRAILLGSNLPVGTHSITATYLGDANYAGSAAAPMTQTVNKGITNTRVTSALTPATFGQSVSFTALVNLPGATGTVTFKDGATTLGTVPLDGGSATFVAGNLPVGTHAITASYSGDANTNGSTSAPLTQAVNKAATTTTVASSLNPSGTGQSVTFTALVSPAAALGSVTFKDGATTLGTVSLSNGRATFVAPNLSQGTHSITAVYAGDANNSNSTSTILTQSVRRPSTTALITSKATSTFGQPVTFTATVPAGASGSVMFKDGTTILGSGSIAATGKASYTTSSLKGGTHSITAFYAGDSTYGSSTSAALTQTVNKASSTTTVTSSLNPSGGGQAVTFTATISPNTATGTVTFKDGATILGTATLSSTGKATLTTSSLTTSGPHTITAVYGGDSNFNTSTSAKFTQTVKKASATTIKSSNASSTSGQPVTFTATVTAGATGSITFMDGTRTLKTIAITPGMAVSYTTTTLAAGPHSITAVYSGDNTYGGSTSAVLTQTVQAMGFGAASVPSGPLAMTLPTPPRADRVTSVALGRLSGAFRKPLG